MLLSKQPPTILLPHVMSLLEGIQKSRFKPPSVTTKLLKLHNISNYIDTYGIFRITGSVITDRDLLILIIDIIMLREASNS